MSERHELSDQEKQTFKAASERRKEAGIKLKRVNITMSVKQVEAFYIVWDAWVERFGKNMAVDGLISLMSRVEARMRDQDDTGESP